MFSLAPLLIVLIAIAGWVLGLQNGGHGHHLAEDALLNQVKRGAGQETADTIRLMVAASFNKPRQGLLAQIIGWVAFLFGASALFSSLQDALNAIWHIEATRGGWKHMLRDRIASFGMILVVGFLLLVTFVANAGVAFVATHFLGQLPVAANPALLALANQVITFVLAAVVFALIYKVLPDVKVSWHDVWVGAAVTAVLFLAGEALIAFYLAKAAVASAYGASGSLLAGLLWIYYSAIVLLLGAEFAKVAAGRAETTAPVTVRTLIEQPAGADPRHVSEQRTGNGAG